jgi:sugar transferase (PEP-CTERM/EpsH1 system associated)
MKGLLFLAHRIPYPPNKGDKIRSYHLLKHLSGRYHVYLGAFVDDPDDWRHAETVKSLCADACLIGLDPRRARLRSLGGFLSGGPLTVAYYRDIALRRWAGGLIESGQIEAVLVFSSGMAQYAGLASPRITKVVDFVDVDSDKWRQYARARPWPMSRVYAREARKLLQYERRVAATARASVFISRHEADLFRAFAPEVADRVIAIANGVDTDYFSPDRVYESPYPANARVIVFTGAMDYWANVDAVRWFALEIFPAIRSRLPDATFCIVGARPVPEVTELAVREGVIVTGAVADVRPYLAHAAVAVAPMRIARGVQNKVLEAMAMGCKVLASPAAMEGIEAEPGRDLIVAGAETMTQCALQVLEDERTDLGKAARRCILRRYRWDDHLRQFETLFESDREQAATIPTPQNPAPAPAAEGS